MAVTAIIGAVVAIAGVVNSIDDAQKRREVEANLGLLNERQLAALNEEMQKRTTKQERIQLVIDTVQKARDAEAARQQTANIVLWITVAAAGIAAVAILAWAYKPVKAVKK